MTWQEQAGSPVEKLSESSGSTSERKLLVPFESRLTRADEIVGTDYPNFPQCRVNSIAIEPWGGGEVPPNSGIITDPSVSTADYTGNLSLITAGYGPDFTKKTWPTGFTKPSFRNETELRFQVSGSSQFLSIPSSDLKWEDGLGVVKNNADGGILISLSAIQIQWDFVDDPPISALEDITGKVCDGSFLGSAAEQLLFQNYSIKESFRASASQPHTNRVTVNFLKRKIPGTVFGWNHFYREDPAGWKKLVLSNGNPLYPTADFSGIFN